MECVARHALSRKSTVKRALFSSPLAMQSKHLGATFVVTKSRLSVATTPTAISDPTCLWIVDSGCSKHMTGNLQLLRNFIEKFMGTVHFRNDHFAAITSYGDYVQGNLTICHVYYVEGLGHNLFSVRQFCDGDLEVAFRSKHMTYEHDMESYTGYLDYLVRITLTQLNDSYLHGYGVCRQSEYAVLGIGQMRFLVKSWRIYAVSL
ncbi:hypothetical protein Tco_0333055 [Tanacetum coccineum]